MSMPTRPTDLTELSNRIEQQTAEFLAAGGQIEQLPDNCTAGTYKDFNSQTRKQVEKRLHGLRMMEKANKAKKRKTQTKRFSEKFPEKKAA